MSAMMVEHATSPPAPGPEMMPRGLALSAALHVGLLAVIVFGLPGLFRPPPPQETPIAVELVSIAPETHATHPNPYRPKREAKPEPALAPPAPIPQQKPTPPPAAAEPPPAAASPPAMPKAPAPAKAERKPPPPPPPPPKPAEARAPPPPPPEPKPKPEAQRPRETPRPDEKKADAKAFAKLLDKLEDRAPDKRPEPAAFDSLLKNLTKQPTAEAADRPPPPTRVAAGAAPSSQPKAPLGSQLTAAQQDLIIQQIERCWDVPAGARDAKDLVIEIKAVVDLDGTVRQAAVVDSGRYASDPFFRAAADSAKRAVLNPRCLPLPVPRDKYEAWHNLDLFFNPKDLL
jgi:hypothetical protein